MRVVRMLRRVLETSAVREDRFMGRPHVVFPAVALVEGVVHAMNAPGPELVPFSELALAPHGWNGRPVTAGHPARDGRVVFANEPEVLEREQIGVLFHTQAADGKLLTEVWLDPSRVRDGTVAERVLARVRAGEMVEVSVGCSVVTEATEGRWHDQPYVGIWRDIMPDHLALLAEGDTGACSIEMGCGAPRAAQEDSMVVGAPEQRDAGAVPPHRGDNMVQLAPRETPWSAPTLSDFTARPWAELTAEERRAIAAHYAWARAMPPEAFGDLKLPHHRPSDGRVVFRGVVAALGRLAQTDIPAADVAAVRRHLEAHRAAFEREAQEGGTVDESKRSVWGRLADWLGWRAALDPEQLSDEDLRQLLTEALTRVESNFFRVVAVRPNQREVIYLVDPDPGGPEPLRPFLRTYELSDDGAVTVGAERVPVRPHTTWEPVITTAKAAVACGCATSNVSCADGATGGEAAMPQQQTERIAALVACPHTPWTEADQAFLASLPDERLAQFEAQAAAARRASEAATAGSAADPAPLTEEQYLASAPESIQRIVAEYKAAQARRREQLVATLRDAAKDAYTADDLAAKPLDELERLARLLRATEPPVDYSGRGAPRLAELTPEAPPKPIDLAARIRAARGLDRQASA